MESSFLKNQKTIWDRSALENPNKLDQIHFIGPYKNPYDSIHEELDYYLHFDRKKTLEVGCGNGLILEKIFPYNRNIYGVDISENLIQILKKSLPDIADHFFATDASALPFPDHHFDIVFSNSIFQYFPDLDYTEKVVNEMLRVCAPGGAIFIGDIYNRRLSQIYEKYYIKEPFLRKLKEIFKNVIKKRLMGKEVIPFKYNYIDPDFFIHKFKKYGRILSLLIWSEKPELFRQFRYNLLIEKNG